MVELSDTPPDCGGGTCSPVIYEDEETGLAYYTGQCQTADGLPCSADFHDDSVGWDAAVGAASAFAEATNGTIFKPSCPERMKAEKIDEYDLGLFTIDVYSGNCVRCVVPIWNKAPTEDGAEVLGYQEGLYYPALEMCGIDASLPGPQCMNGGKATYVSGLTGNAPTRQGYFLCQGDAVGQAQPTDYGNIPPRQPYGCQPPNIPSRENDGTESCYAPCGPNEVFDHNDSLCGCAPGYGREDGSSTSPCVKKDPPKGASKEKLEKKIAAGAKAKPGLSVAVKVGLGALALGALGLAVHLATRKKKP